MAVVAHYSKARL